MPPRSKAVPNPADLARALDEIAVIVRRDGGLSRSRLAKLGVSKATQPDAVARLEREGIEVTPRLLRIPLGTQLAGRLREGAILPMRTLRNAVFGATAGEIATAARTLVRAGDALLVLRGKELALSAPRDGIFGEPDLTALERTLAALGKTLKDARKQRAVLLRSDVHDVLGPFISASVPTSARAARLALPHVLAQVQTLRHANGLVFVPSLVRALGGAVVRDAVHEVLRDAAERGLVELRPESGLARLSEEDLAFCLPGPQGSRLSWARPIEGPQ